MKKTCIIGSGICGLTAAWEKERQGCEVTLLDAAKRAGGVIESVEDEGFLLDYGPNTLSLRLAKTEAMLRDSGILDHAIDANPEAVKRFVVRKGKLVAMPHGLSSFLGSRFLSFSGKLRLLLEPFLPRGKANNEESVASFVSRRMGREILDYGANPFLAGVYAARPETLNLRHTLPALHQLEQKHRSLLLGMIFGAREPGRLPRSRLLSFPLGMEELPNRILANLQGRALLGHEVTQVVRGSEKWRIEASVSGGASWAEDFDEVVCAIPAHRLGGINWRNVEGAEDVQMLGNAPHFPLSVVYHGYDAKDLSHPLDGFGFLVPEIEEMNILGTLFSSTLFPGRAPEGKVLLTTFVGGERNPELALREDDAIHEAVTRDLSSLLGIKSSPAFQRIRTWNRAIPLPDAGFEKRKRVAEKLKQSNPGLFFSGGHLTGPALPNCLDPLV